MQDYLKVPLKTQIRYDNATYDSAACMDNLHFILADQKFDFEAAMNDCTLNELIF